VKSPSVVVVLAGGGAKGFAHLAVLRRLEQDRIPIARIVGTSMGAVIGGLYASGLSTDEIERVVGGLDPSKVALDQLNRLELPSRTRAYQQKYPVDFEFGVKNGGASFARGVSDGQRFLALLQDLTSHVPPQVNFNDLKIPFRAVATRYRDGEM
jgi:NTE family protein